MRVLLIFALLVISFCSSGQSPLFVNTIQASGTQVVHGVDEYANKDIIVVGEFGSTVDFDPSPATLNLTASGPKDIFVARYTVSGALLWAFKVGGTSVDGAYGVKIDNDNNIVVTGYYRNTADFDPSVNINNLIANGFTGSNLNRGGDIFVAKYTPNGNYIWAFSVGGDYIQDTGESVDIDVNNNIYISGAINPTSSGQIDFDPNAGVFDLSGSPNGHAFVAKYSPSGNFNWAFAVGDYGANSAFHKLKVVPNDTTIVVAGHFIGNNTDFDPGPSTANLSSLNNFSDIVLAKYSLNGNYQWAFAVGGPSSTLVDEAIGLAVDFAQNIYITGYFSSNNVDFDPGSGVNNLNVNGGNEVFLAKYNAQGSHIWSKAFGGTGNDLGFGVDVVDNMLITSGQYESTVDFDPAASITNSTSNGSSDIYVSQFDTAGNFNCVFNMGGGQSDISRAIKFSGTDSLLLLGSYASNSIDFDPTAAVLLKSNSGLEDGYFGKYELGCISPDTIINHYAAVQSYDSCTNSIIVGNATDFNIGDTILMIQMKGAIVDSSNSPSFGNILNYNSAGNYEENIIQNINGNTVSLVNLPLRIYDFQNGKVQIVTIPQFTNYTINTKHLAAPWDGNMGGVFAMNVVGTLTMNNDIDVSGLGFRGGTPSNSSIVNCNQTDYYYPVLNNQGGNKGEGIAQISSSKIYGRGKLASGGGGGNSHNSGGGGGANGGIGGQGGNQYNWSGCTSTYVPGIGGLGGSVLSYSNSTNKIFLGGGGGCGHANNQGGNVGGDGGGLIYLSCNTLISNNAAILANGDEANYASIVQLGVNDDGGNGGGSGGTVLLNCTAITNSLNINILGGGGSDAHTATTPAGPGGGGSGGVFWINQSSVPSNLSISALGGTNGVVPQLSNTPFGALSGQSGQTLTSLVTPFANIPFAPFNNINAGNDTSICSGQTVQLNASGAVSYSWSPTSVSNPLISNPTVTPISTTSYIVTGLYTSGCVDQDTVQVFVTPGPTITVISTADTICIGDNVTLTATGATNYSWTGGVINATPFAPTTSGVYTVTGTDANGCVATSSYTIAVLPAPTISVISSQPIICQGDSVFFIATGASSYSWSPTTGLNNANIANPFSVPNSSITYTVTGSIGSCTDQSLVNVRVRPQPIITAAASKDPICLGESVSLTASGANTYSWTNGVQHGVPFGPVVTTTYSVIGVDANGCTNTDNIIVTVNPLPTITLIPAEPAVCLGDSIMLYATGAQSYLWSPSSTLSSPTLDSTWSKPFNDITYTVLGTDANNCRNSATISVIVVDDLNLELKKNADINCNKIPVQLSVKGGYTYTWEPAQFLNANTISNPIADIKETTTFYVTSQLGNCLSTDSITVFYYNNAESGLFIPNAFTPNSDGLNDCYHIRTQGNYEFYELYIYNRWGQAVFESGNPMDCWNGNYKGEPVPVGTYFYYLRAISECGEVFKKGDINVIR